MAVAYDRDASCYERELRKKKVWVAQDRAYRIGKKRNVDVVKLITRGTVEEGMLRLGQMKLDLDEAVAGDGDEQGAVDCTAWRLRFECISPKGPGRNVRVSRGKE